MTDDRTGDEPFEDDAGDAPGAGSDANADDAPTPESVAFEAPDPADAATGRSRVEGLPDGWLEADASAAGGSDLLPGRDADDVRDVTQAAEESGVSHASRVLIGTGRSGIVSPSDVLATESNDARDREGIDDDAAPTSSSGAAAAPGEDPESADPIDEWRDIAAVGVEEGASESVGFGALLAADASGQELSSDSYTGDSQGLVGAATESIDIAVPPITAVPSPRKPQGMIGQLVGVVLGGVLAIPVTLAILLWGFGRDPMGVAKSIPPGMRFLLPASLRGSAEPRPRGPVSAGPTLDSLASLATPPREGADGPIAGDGPGGRSGGSASPSPAAPATASAEPPTDIAVAEPPAPAITPEETLEAIAASPVAAATVAMEDVPIGIDLPTLPSAATPAAAAPSQPDLSALEVALERALVATENVSRIDPAGDPQLREQALVAWYRELVDVAGALAAADRAAGSTVAGASAAALRYGALADRLASERGGDLAELGRMWLTASRRPADGAVLIGILEETRGAGPWWWGRISIRGEVPHRVAFFANGDPGVSVGEGVMVTGVIGDPSTMWASDVRAVPGHVRGEGPGAEGAAPAAAPADPGAAEAPDGP